MAQDPATVHSLLADDFFYYFWELRKPRIREVVARLREIRPEETPEQHARRLIESHAALSALTGTVLQTPLLLPGLGAVLKAVGLVAGATVVTRMHLYLILEIALLYGKDIDSTDRVPEMVQVVAATAATAAVPPIAVSLLDLHPMIAIPVGGLSCGLLTRLIGEAAIQRYGSEPARLSGQPAPA